MSTALATSPATELVRQSTDIAGLCKSIVLKSAMDIQGRKYVKVEGWQSIATAHGCLASSCDVQRVEGGYKATGEVRRMTDGVLLASAEGFVGEDEPTWFGGEIEFWNSDAGEKQKKTLPKRLDYAIRAMCQTRAISRACRSAFAHVVVLMDAGLSTTPAEEVPQGGFEDAGTSRNEKPADAGRLTDSPVPGNYWTIKNESGQDKANKWLSASFDGAKVGVRKVAGKGWFVVIYGQGNAPAPQEDSGSGSGESGELELQPKPWTLVKVHFGKNGGPLRGKTLGELDRKSLDYLRTSMEDKAKTGTKNMSKPDRHLLASLTLEFAERGAPKPEAQVEPEPETAERKFNGKNHEALAESLAFAQISEADFMSAAKELGWIPKEATKFEAMSDPTALKFVDDFQTLQDGVKDWLQMKEGEEVAPGK